MTKETSDKIAEIAVKYLKFHPVDFSTGFGRALSRGPASQLNYTSELCKDIRSLAGSCLSQSTPNDPA